MKRAQSKRRVPGRTLRTGALLTLLVPFLLSVFAPAGAGAGQEPATEGPVRSERRPPLQNAPHDGPKEAHEILFRANQAYLEGQYAEAASGYESLLEWGCLNGHVFYNLGNTYVRMGRIGRAVLEYRRAALLLPRDGDLKANLQYARSLRQDRLETETAPSLWRTLVFWYHGLNFRELLLAFLAFHALFWAVALLRLYRKSEWSLWLLGCCLFMSLLMGVSAAIKYRETLYSRDGVVLASEIPVRAGFTQNDTILYVLHEGTEFSGLGEENGWLKIALGDGKKGWIPASAAARLGLKAGTAPWQAGGNLGEPATRDPADERARQVDGLSP
ncbi:MAG: SH3 domain-containing protein [bacterium]